MEVQLKFVTKEEAHEIINSIPGDGVFVLTYSNKTGKSDNGKYIKKKRGNRLVDNAKTLVLSKSKVISLNLHDIYFGELDDFKREGIIKTILIPKLE